MTGSERYSRQVILPGLGAAGQEKLAAARVLVVGAGGLGCPALQYLAAAGVGMLGIVDGDVVTESNLNRQLLYSAASIGRAKAPEAAAALKTLNPGPVYQPHRLYLGNRDALAIIPDYDVVIDATDNFETRYLLNDACVLLDKPLVYGSISRFEGQVSVFNQDKQSANYRDIFPVPPARETILNCAESGVLGVLPGIIGTMQAAEAIKLVTGIGRTLSNRLVTFNLLRQEWIELALTPRPGTPDLIPAGAEAFMAYNYRENGTSCEPEYTDVGPEAFDELLASPGAVVIDVREHGEHPRITQFPHVAIPMSEIVEKAAAYRHRTIVLFCHAGIRSAEAAAFFPRGNKVYHLKGGIVKWLRYHQRRVSH
ncbi:HesA/MoeB/ThiF family protein [Hufsiella ginkgonis]|uniref:Molybdopterin-synthase adenylyltransferase n=1 Tax=Hufsiella ginkgonis TaxID=2695274 RepID=A0A7K1XZV9_9SPHI|nr:HesA/MoeB/ThiF family protein [Hufsiella ginkgonis]MXV16066.1 hypothetical protein [Hufsiella ginkgonis]